MNPNKSIIDPDWNPDVYITTPLTLSLCNEAGVEPYITEEGLAYYRSLSKRDFNSLTEDEKMDVLVLFEIINNL